jgi:hypothetical protein
MEATNRIAVKIYNGLFLDITDPPYVSNHVLKFDGTLLAHSSLLVDLLSIHLHSYYTVHKIRENLMTQQISGPNLDWINCHIINAQIEMPSHLI